MEILIDLYSISPCFSLLSVVWFEIGSLFCAVAPSVNFLIFGRAVAGLGGAGSKCFLHLYWAWYKCRTPKFSFPCYLSSEKSHVWKTGPSYSGKCKAPRLLKGQSTYGKLCRLFGGVFGLSSILGPLLGGAFTDHVSWRWCFYINLVNFTFLILTYPSTHQHYSPLVPLA